MSICKNCNVFFEKGIGSCCSRKCHNGIINKRDRSNDKHVLEATAREDEYNLNPKLCENCSIPLSYKAVKQWDGRFCSQSCGAIHSNNNRDSSSYEQQAITLRLNIDEFSTTRVAHWPVSSVIFKYCKHCNNAFRSIHSREYCSYICKGLSSIKRYRIVCKFKISKTLYPQLFNIPLLTDYGWYRASNHPKGYNPNGATWDHLFRIEDGYRLGIDPTIMSHPANAEMISWMENISRKKSTITYDELIQKINCFPK